MANNELIMYTDGAARGKPGPGGYGTILMWGGRPQGAVAWLPAHNE